MSRGAGRIERAIHDLLAANPDLAFTTDELAEHCYGVSQEQVTRAHRVSVLRAAIKVIESDPDWTRWPTQGQGRGWVFVNEASLQSHCLAWLMTDYQTYYRSPKRARRKAGRYLNRWGRAVTEQQLAWEREHGIQSVDWHGIPITSPWFSYGHLLTDRASLLARLAPGGKDHDLLKRRKVHVELHIAKRDGDTERAAAIEAELEAGLKVWTRGLKAIAAGRRPPLPQPEQPAIREQLAGILESVQRLPSENDPDAARIRVGDIAKTLETLISGTKS
jgi:hypothetical protein